MHKLGLSIDENNLTLSKFYVHGVEEVIKELERFGQYNNLILHK